MASPAPGPRLASLGDDARRLCQALLRMDTTNPPGNERICADYLAAALAEVGYQPGSVSRLRADSRFTSTIATAARATISAP